MTRNEYRAHYRQMRIARKRARNYIASAVTNVRFVEKMHMYDLADFVYGHKQGDYYQELYLYSSCRLSLPDGSRKFFTSDNFQRITYLRWERSLYTGK